MDTCESSPHILFVLFESDHREGCLFHWREQIPVFPPQPGEFVPLPEAALDAAGWDKDAAARVEAVFRPEDLPGSLQAALPAAPGTACTSVVELRTVMPEVSPDGFVAIGGFEPADARRLLPLLEEHGVPFEVEQDHSALLQAGRSVSLYLGFQPPGSCLQVWVAGEHLGHVRKLLRYLFPPEIPPPSQRSSSPAGEQPPPASPVMEAYAPPAADLSGRGRGQFLKDPDAS